MTSTPSAPAPEPVDYSGRTLGDFQLLRRLGKGGMAEVYLAKQISLGRNVAFKVLQGHLADDPQYIQRFHKEARAAARLVHANIVQIHEVGCVDGIHYIAQEYVAGQNLRQLLSRQAQPLDARTSVSVLRQVAAALHRAAAGGIVHRDIKPENILLAATGEVKVADFGLARATDDGEQSITKTGVTLGTPLYMSPEQIEGRPLDPRSDIYSLGVTAYHMLAGKPPFHSSSTMALALQHLRDAPERLEDLRPDVPPGLCRIVHKMLAKKQEDRFASPVELLRELRQLAIDGLETDWPAENWSAELAVDYATACAATEQLTTLMRTETRQRLRNRRVGWWVAAGMLGSLLLGGLVAAGRHQPLLRVAPGEIPPVERMRTPQDQFLHASLLKTEAAWMSVWEYFPPSENSQNEYYALRARQRLAEHYHSHDQLGRAMKTYTVLADSTQDEFRAIGLAGQANLWMEMGDEMQTDRLLSELLPLMRDQPQVIPQVFDTLSPAVRARAGDALRDSF